MGVMAKLKNALGMNEYDEENSFEEEYEEAPQPRSARKEHNVSYDDRKVVSMSATAQLKVVLLRPESYSRDANPIADHLKAKRAVVINFERTINGEARRLLDFLSGVAYAQDGNVQRIAEKAFLITPYNVEIESNDFLYEIENGLCN